ncbi:MAG: type II toxin-antitoxin system VapC family toxin [Proteobacteria bacterium]|nr:type II toxin-antitoxin system VapC family toxin [Pseudomonadota bacterium]
MVIDSSAVLAIFFDEPERSAFVDLISGDDEACMGAPNLLEASMIVEARQGKAGCRDLDELAGVLELRIVPFDVAHVEAARDAFRRYGKGRHRAALNFGDCCAYGLARTLDAPLLFKGNDFSLTDVKRAL